MDLISKFEIAENHIKDKKYSGVLITPGYILYVYDFFFLENFLESP